MKKKSQPRKPTGGEERAVLGSIGQHAILLDLRMVGCNVSFGDANLQAGQVEIGQTINVKSAQLPEAGDLRFLVTFELAARQQDASAHFTISESIGVMYRVTKTDGLDPDTIQKFGEFFALMHAWPYWREFVQSMCGRMGLPPITVPLMRPNDMTFKRDK